MTDPLADPITDPILAWARAQQPALIDMLRHLVESESPSDSAADVDRCQDLFASLLANEANFSVLNTPGYGRQSACRFRLPGPAKRTGQILALGHMDTVWPLGTLAKMPFREADGRLWGPGVLDMKAGLVFFVFAMRALRELDIPIASDVLLQINSDEEVGSPVSRGLTEKNALESKAVLVLEPGTGLGGNAKTARKGIGRYELTAYGVASHAGVDFEKGASAIVELSRQIVRMADFVDLKHGVTINPGTLSGGTRSNVVAAEAKTEIDFRVPRMADFDTLNRHFQSLEPIDPLCSLVLTGGLNRPPMERSKGVVALYELAKKAAKELGIDLEESSTGGGSDGNFTAALGIPTLDGIGAVGEGAHANYESILVDRIADRVALLAKLVAAIS